MTDKEHRQYLDFINKILYEVMTIEDYKYVMSCLDIPLLYENETYVQYRSYCHNVDNGKGNLFLYKESKSFYCFSGCQCSYSLLSLVEKRFQLICQPLSNVKCMKWICEKLEIPFNFSVSENTTVTVTSNWKKILSRYNKNIKDYEKVTYDKNIVNCFPKIYHKDWLDYGISEETLDKYNIRYYPLKSQIIIPCNDSVGDLIGIRVRNMNPNSESKYIPLRLVDGEEYKFPTNEYFYGANFNSEAIKRNKIAWLVEAEKSVLKADTWFGENNVTLGMYGSKLSDVEIKYLLSLGIDTIVIMLDSDFEDIESEEFEKFKNKVLKMAEKLKPYMTVYVCYNNQGYKNSYKFSPFDFTREQFDVLYENKEIID